MTKDNGTKGMSGMRGPSGLIPADYEKSDLRLPRLKDLKEQFEASRDIVERVLHIPYNEYKAYFEKETEIEIAYEDALQKGFKGSLCKFKNTIMDDGGVDGWIGISIRKEYASFVEEGFYTGTYEEFLKFKERCHWIDKSQYCLAWGMTSDQDDSQKEYQKCTEQYYRGTLESFKRFLAKYFFVRIGMPAGPIGAIGRSGRPGITGGGVLSP